MITDYNKVSHLPPVKSVSNLSDSGELTVATEVSDSSSDNSRVSFGAIHVREYERIVGDHPETQVGVPLSLGWGYFEREAVDIDTYERNHVSKGTLRMSSITRKNILHNVFGIPESELRAAEREVQRISNSKPHTAKHIQLGKKKKSLLKRAGKKILRAVSAENLVKGLSFAASNGVLLSGSMSQH